MSVCSLFSFDFQALSQLFVTLIDKEYVDSFHFLIVENEFGNFSSYNTVFSFSLNEAK